MINPQELEILKEALDRLSEGFNELPTAETAIDADRIRAVLGEVATRMQDNFPYHHFDHIDQLSYYVSYSFFSVFQFFVKKSL